MEERLYKQFRLIASTILESGELEEFSLKDELGISDVIIGDFDSQRVTLLNDCTIRDLIEYASSYYSVKLVDYEEI